jgi:hypothetical protein
MEGLAHAVIYCEEMQRLADEYTSAVQEYLRIEKALPVAIIGELEAGIESQVRAAAIRLFNTKHALEEHREAHHCMD